MLRVEGLKKSYLTDQGRVDAVRGVTFEVDKGEVFTLLGPSGCGKSSTIRCVAGLELPEEGEIWIGGKVVFASRTGTNLSTFRRGIGMVFQSYAIWPHMTVFDNVAFPLQYGNFRMPKSEVREKVKWALNLVKIAELENRPAPLLSGGQQQRVALARALVCEPCVLLLDEPLSNLDAQLRAEMQFELRELISRLGMTSIYVTHDQQEALVLSDRIGVMHEGRVVQEGTPRVVYMQPATVFSASFIGRSNFFEGKVIQDPSQNGTVLVECAHGKMSCFVPERSPRGSSVLLAIRPENVVVHGVPLPADVANVFEAAVSKVSFLGDRMHCELEIGGQRVLAEVGAERPINRGQVLGVEFPPDKVRVFSREG